MEYFQKLGATMTDIGPKKHWIDRFGEWMVYGSAKSRWGVGGLFCLLLAASAQLVTNLFRRCPYRELISNGFMALLFTGIMVLLFVMVRRLFMRALLDYQTDPRMLKHLSWHRLELLVSELYSRCGYKVRRRTDDEHASADGGVDIDLWKDGKHIIVQCKKWTHESVGVNKVREVLGVLHAERAHAAVCITTSFFTEEAERFAYDKPVELIDASRLWEFIQSVQGEAVLQETLRAPQARTEFKEGDSCPKCDGVLVPRQSKYGPFLGCSNYAKTGCGTKIDPRRGDVG